MFFALKGIVHKLAIPQIALDVSGVSYLLSVPYPLWEGLREGDVSSVIVYTYVREDRLDLFGFQNLNERNFFSELLNISGIGPKLAIELLSVSKGILVQAVHTGDTGLLTSIKGIGRKTAEKLIVDLKSLSEKHPEWLNDIRPEIQENHAALDFDAIAALTSLGYDQPTVLAALKKLPPKIKKTEDRVTAVLRSL